MSKQSVLHLAIMLLGITGCAVGPDYKPPNLSVPKTWHETNASIKAGEKAPEKWWHTFHDPVLDQLITEAIAANLDLKQALARVKIARTQRTSTVAAGLPEVTSRSNLSRRFNSTSSPSQTGSSTVGGGFGIGPQNIDIFQLGFDAQWELDFFGGVRRAVEAADAAIDTELENSRAVWVTVLAEVARNYIDLRSNQKLLDVSRQNLAAQQETYSLTQVRQRAGLASMLEVTQAQFAVANTEAQLPDYETQIRQSIHALAILLGREPGALFPRLSPAGFIPMAHEEVITNLPSELLLRRPDIRRAERQMASANAEIGVATAELYPKLNLAAFLGIQNLQITDITPVGKSWSTAASISMPIFNWGKLNANIKNKKILYEQTFLSYQSSVLSAFKEVEDALVAYHNEQKRQKSLLEAVDAERLAVRLSNELYQKGLTSFLNVLESQQDLYEAERNLVTSEAKISSNLVALYKALGGGWQSEAAVAEYSHDSDQ